MRQSFGSYTFQITSGLLLFALALLGVFLPSGTALATQTHQERAVATCFGDGCTGQDPYRTGCADSFYTLLAQDDPLGGQLRVELEYSPLCGTKWTQAYWLDSVKRPLGANIIRQSGADGIQRKFSSYWTDGNVWWWINTDQVWSPNSAGEACAYAAQVGIGPYPGVCVRQ